MVEPRHLLLLLTLPAVCLIGCSGGPAFEADAPAPGIAIEEAPLGEGTLSAETAFSRDPIIARYTRYEGGSARPSSSTGEIQVFGSGDRWMIERYRLPQDPDAEPVLSRRVLLSEGGDGSVLLHESVGGGKNLTTIFDPPVQLVAPLMRAGDTLEGTFTPRIRDASGERNETGDGTYRVTYAGRQNIETPMGAFEADLLMTEFVFDFGVVKVTRRARQWIATIRPGRTTIVAEEITERQTVFGISTTDRVRLAIESLVR